MIDLDLRIGIVLNYKKAEQKKDELYCIDKYPWLGLAKDPKYNSLTINKKGKTCVPADLAIGLFLESLPQNENVKIVIDYIQPVRRGNRLARNRGRLAVSSPMAGTSQHPAIR